jgi:hypothetical protein
LAAPSGRKVNIEREREREKRRREKNAINSEHYIPPATPFSVKNHYLTQLQLEEM